MILQAELAIEIIVQFTCSSHGSINFRLLASEVFFIHFQNWSNFQDIRLITV